MYDIIVVGGGPAGLTAALYARRANKTVLVIEKGSFGGQITYSPKVENIPGFGEVTGNEFAEKLVEQVLNQDAHGSSSSSRRILLRHDAGTDRLGMAKRGFFVVEQGATARVVLLVRECRASPEGIAGAQ